MAGSFKNISLQKHHAPYKDHSAKRRKLDHEFSAKQQSKPNVTNKTNGHKAPSDGQGSQLSLRASKLLETRKQLPIWQHRSEIQAGLRKDVMLLVGETGSGKSTQVPQFLVDQKWARPRYVTSGKKENVKVGGCIAITQPRRVAAITLARRVAEEVGTPLGTSSPGSTVGYNVRFDNNASKNTKIKFLTEGMLLQEMLRDPWLKDYSAVVVDEVHERGVNVDLILGFLRRIVAGKKEGRGSVPLKVVVMSATAELEALRDFFDEAYQPVITNGHTNGHASSLKHENSSVNDEDSEWAGLSDHEDEKINQSSPVTNGHKKSDSREPVSVKSERLSDTEHVSIQYIQGRQYQVQTFYCPNPEQDWVDAALRTIFQINYQEPLPGDILVFLPGQETIENLESLVRHYAQGLQADVPRILVLPLFAALPQAAQQRVFQPTKGRTRKVILSTNIAETSVTVPGVRFVIDCGKSKVKQFRASLGLDSLLVKPISRSAAIQRKGRAGREAPGKCYRLYTEDSYLELQEANDPEILRCDLSQAILMIKARGVTDLMSFPFLTRPLRTNLEQALLQLSVLGTLEESGAISELGTKIAKLPLTATLGRVLLAASDAEVDAPGCLDAIIDIISCLSVENVFLNPSTEEAKETAENARRDIYRREGDHLTLLATVRAYAAENVDRKQWSEKHFVSHRAMQSVMDIRKQLYQQTQIMRGEKRIENGEKSGDSTQAQNPPTHSASLQLSESVVAAILKCLLAGFAHNTARLCPDGSYKTIVGNQIVGIHPSSVLYGKKVEAVVYTEYVFTNRSYARGVSAVQMDWIDDAWRSMDTEGK